MSPGEPPRLTRSLTARGRTVALATLFAWLLAWTVGGALAFAAAAFAALFGVGLLFARTPLGRVRIRALPPASGEAGQPFALQVPLSHTGRTGVLRDTIVRVALGSGTRPLGYLAALGPGEEAVVAGVHRIARRGRHTSLALVLDCTDPLGLLRTTARHEVAVDLLVLPRVVSLPDTVVPRRRRAGAVDASTASRGAAQEPSGVREWRSGETLRHVHWRLSARRGELLVHDLRGDERGTTHVVLDPRVRGAGRERGRAFDDAVTLAASFAAHELAAHRVVRLSVANAEHTTTRARSGRSALPAMLTTLAAVETADPAGDVAVIPPVRGETTVVVTAGEGRDTALTAWRTAGHHVLDTDDETVRRTLRARTTRRPVRRTRAERERAAASPLPLLTGLLGVSLGAALLLHADVPLPAVLALALAPGVSGRVRASGRGRVLRRALPVALISFAVVALGTVLVRDPALGVLAALVAALSLALGGLAAENARTAVPALAPAVAVASLALATGGVGGVALLAVAPLAYAAAADVVSARRRRTVDRATRRTSAPAGAGRRPFVGPVLAGVAFSLFLATLVPLAAWAPLRSVRVDADSVSARDLARRRRALRAAGAAGASSSSFEFPSGVSGDSIPLPGYEIVMEVEPRDAAGSTGPIGPLLLRGVALTRFGPDGPTASSVRLPPRVPSDGGWSPIGPRVPIAERVELRVSHYEMPVPPYGWSLLFTTDGTEAVGFADLRHDPERFTILDEAPAEWFTYDLRVRDPRLGALVSAASKCEPASGWHIQVPAASSELARVTEEARRVTSGARNDVERVDRVVRYFRNDFRYTRDVTRPTDVAGVLDLLETRQGFCTHYATAAMLMLRTQGIPARLVSGFLVQEWDRGIAAYVVRPRDTHAWIEVRFEDAGWVAFDPTPPDASRETDASSPAARWAADALDDVGSLFGGGGASALRSLGATLARTPRGVRLVLAALVFGALLAQVAWLVQRTRAARAEAPLDATARQALRLAERLERALAQNGFRRVAAETRRELAERVVRARGDALSALSEVVGDLDAARFGGVALSAAALSRIDDLLGTLRAGSSSA